MNTFVKIAVVISCVLTLATATNSDQINKIIADKNLTESATIKPQTLYVAGELHCNYEYSSIIDIEVVWLGSNFTDQIYFLAPTTFQDGFTKITAGPAELYYGYFTFTITRHSINALPTDTEYLKYGFFNDNQEKSVYLTYDVTYNCME